MRAEFWPVTEDFAAEVGDVDLSQPISQDDLAAIRAAFSICAGVAVRIAA